MALNRGPVKGASSWREQEKEEEVRRQFELIDENQDGTIQRAELAEVLKFLDASLWSDANIDALLVDMDTNEDGKIQYAEFVKYVFANTDGDDTGRFFSICEEAALRERKVRARNREDKLVDVQVSMLSGTTIVVEDLRASTSTATLYASVAKLLKVDKDDFVLAFDDNRRLPADGATLSDVSVEAGTQLTVVCIPKSAEKDNEALKSAEKISNGYRPGYAFTQEEIAKDRVEGTYDPWESNDEYAYSRPSHFERKLSYDSFLSSW